MATILVVDDDPQVLALTRQALVAAGHDVVGSLSASEAIHSCRTKRPSVAVVDWKLSGLDGIDLFADFLDRCPDLRGILITAYDLTPPSIDRALRARFTRFLHKPFSVDALVSAVAEEVALAKRGRQESRSSGTSSRPPEHATNVSPLACLIGDSLAMERVRDRLMTFARYPHPVHLFGETGTGKELAAQAIHDLSDRARDPSSP